MHISRKREDPVVKAFNLPHSPIFANICPLANGVYPPATARPFKGGWVDKQVINPWINLSPPIRAWRINTRRVCNEVSSGSNIDSTKRRFAVSPMRRFAVSPIRRFAELKYPYEQRLQ